MAMTKIERLEYNKKYYILQKAWNEGLLEKYPFGNGVRRMKKIENKLQSSGPEHSNRVSVGGVSYIDGKFKVSFD